jgi:tRNA modification GTPase
VDINYDGNILDKAIVIYFAAPNSFTGEDVVEIQCHGSVAVIQQIIQACLKLGASSAGPGEFTKRAFLNDKIDLVQAEAIADLISSQNQLAAKAAIQNLQGKFSNKIFEIEKLITSLRMHIEASIDFSDEDIEFVELASIKKNVINVTNKLKEVISHSNVIGNLQDGIKIVIAGPPNAGKSTLINYLLEDNVAIVSDIEGTTRDIVEKNVDFSGLNFILKDTAGIREDTKDIIEKEGIERSKKALEHADHVLWLVPYNQVDKYKPPKTEAKVTLVHTKIDEAGPSYNKMCFNDTIEKISAKTGEGIKTLKDNLVNIYKENLDSNKNFMVRQRHFDSLQKCITQIDSINIDEITLDLLAEDLKIAHNHLGEITGKITSDDLLGKIFTSFCIGK